MNSIVNSRFFVFLIVLTIIPLRGYPSTDSLAIIHLEQSNKEQDQKIEALTAQLDSLQNDLKTINELTETIKKPSSLMWKLGLPLGILFLIVPFLWKALVRLEPRWFTKFIQRLVEKYEEINVLKSKKSIAILLPEDKENKKGRNDFLHTFFTTKEFKKTTFLKNITQYVPLDKPVDVFFAYNEYGGLKQEVLEVFLNKNPNAYLFYFGHPGSWDFSRFPELNKRVNLANSRSQIYGNLLSTLKLQDLTTPKITL